MALVEEKAVTITGKQWIRASAVTIYNDYGEIPKFVWQLERITQDSTGKTILKENVGQQTFQIEPGQTIPLLNPETGEKIRDAISDELYAFMFSAFAYARQNKVNS